MPLLVRNISPAFVSFQGKDVEKIFYNGEQVWKAFPRVKSLENTPWADIALVCRAGLASQYWQPGDTKCLVEGDPSIQLQILGFDHDPVTDPDAYGRPKAGLTLQMLQLPPPLYVSMNGTNFTGTSWDHSSSYYRCTVRTTHFPAYLKSSIPEDLKNVLVPVNKTYIMADTGAEGTVSDTLFLPSLNEIMGNISSGFGRAGTQYAYFAQGGSRIKKTVSDSAATWWTRSPTGPSAQFYQINTSGETTSNWVTNSAYAPPCMCI